MRIWHQGMHATNRVGGLRSKMEELAGAVADPGTEIDFFGLGAGRGEADRLAGVAVNYLYLHRLQVDQVIRNARQAEAEGYDAFICASLDDPGLQEVRTMVRIPAVGYGQTAMHVASMLGNRIAIIAFLPDYIALVEANIRQYSLERKFTPVIELDLTYQGLEDAFHDPTKFLEAFTASAKKAWAAGADIIIPGQAPINEALYFNGVTNVEGMSVLNTRALTIKFTEMMVRLKQLTGIDSSRRGYFGQHPPADLVKIAEDLFTGSGEDPKAASAG